MSDQPSPQNLADRNLAEQENPYQGGLVDLLSDDRPKFHAREFRFDIFYVAWLLNWIALAPGGFPSRIGLFKGWQIVDALGFVFVFAPVISLLGAVLMAPVIAVAAWAICAAANAMGYRRNSPAPGPFDDRPSRFTVTRCLLFVGAVVLMFALSMFRMLGLSLSTFIQVDPRLSYLLFVLFFIAYVIGSVYLLLYIGSDRPAETPTDQDAQTDAD